MMQTRARLAVVRGLNKFRSDLSSMTQLNPRQPEEVFAHSAFVSHFRRPDLPVDPENLKVRESIEGDSPLDNRFSGPTSGNAAPKKKCGLQTFMNRIVGGEICEIDEFPWAALLLYESSKRETARHVVGIPN